MAAAGGQEPAKVDMSDAEVKHAALDLGRAFKFHASHKKSDDQDWWKHLLGCVKWRKAWKEMTMLEKQQKALEGCFGLWAGRGQVEGYVWTSEADEPTAGDACAYLKKHRARSKDEEQKIAVRCAATKLGTDLLVADKYESHPVALEFRPKHEQDAFHAYKRKIVNASREGLTAKQVRDHLSLRSGGAGPACLGGRGVSNLRRAEVWANFRKEAAAAAEKLARKAEE